MIHNFYKFHILLEILIFEKKMSTHTTKSEQITSPPRLTYEQMIEDLSSIPINENDIVFKEFSENSDFEATITDELYKRFEKFILFKENLELMNQNLKSDFSLNNLSEEFESLEKRLGSLQQFIDLSRKFISIDKH